MINQKLLLQFCLQTQFIGFCIIPVHFIIDAEVIEKQFVLKESEINYPLDALIPPDQSILSSQVLRQVILILDMDYPVGFFVNEYSKIEVFEV